MLVAVIRITAETSYILNISVQMDSGYNCGVMIRPLSASLAHIHVKSFGCAT